MSFIMIECFHLSGRYVYILTSISILEDNTPAHTVPNEPPPHIQTFIFLQ